MISSAVQQAVQLLQSKLGELAPKTAAIRNQIKSLEQQLEALSKEEAEITQALTQLGAPTKPTRTETFVRGVVEVLEAASDTLSVRAAVQRLLEGTPKAFDTQAIALAVAPVVQGRPEERLRGAVRTALWQLRNKNIIVSREDGTHVAVKWIALAEERQQQMAASERPELPPATADGETSPSEEAVS